MLVDHLVLKAKINHNVMMSRNFQSRQMLPFVAKVRPKLYTHYNKRTVSQHHWKPLVFASFNK